MKRNEKVSSQELEEQGWEYLGMYSNLSIWGLETERILWDSQDETVYSVYERAASFRVANKQGKGWS